MARIGIVLAISVGLATIGVCVFCAVYFGSRTFYFIFSTWKGDKIKMINLVLKKIWGWIKKRFWEPLLLPDVEHDKGRIKRIILTAIYSFFFVAGLVISICIPNTYKPYPIYTLFFWGMICSIPFIPKMFKAIFRAGKAAYTVGKTATEREYTEINQTSPTTYSAYTRRTHDGGFFAYMAGFFVFIGNVMLYALIGPFILGIKIFNAFKSIIAYNKKSVLTSISDGAVKGHDDNETTA